MLYTYCWYSTISWNQGRIIWGNYTQKVKTWKLCVYNFLLIISAVLSTIPKVMAKENLFNNQGGDHFLFSCDSN